MASWGRGLRFSAAIGVVMAAVPGVACAAPPTAGIYQLDDDSAIHLTDRVEGRSARLLATFDPGSEGAPVVRATTPASTKTQARRAANPALDAIVSRAAGTHRIDPALIHAVIAAESGYSPTAVSSKGAQGLMQLMPATARDYGVTDPFDPRQNVNAGAQHLRRLLDAFGQDATLALAAYNAGEGAVARHGGKVPPYVETMAYVPRVLQRYASLRDAPMDAVAAPIFTPVSTRVATPASTPALTPANPAAASPPTHRSTLVADFKP
jgi:soluble lytic murein transglycosylase-like protein